MAYDPSIFNINPYYDDFDGDKGFLRVLFKPGYALQARELTQLQSILQDQLSNVSDHLFKDGSRIVGGGISVRNCNSIRVSSSAFPGVSDFSSFLGGVLTDGSGNEAKIVHLIPRDADSTDELTLVLDFTSGDEFTLTGTDPALNYSNNGETESIPVTGNGSTRCKLVTVSDGIFYIDGFFVRVPQQTFSPYSLGGNGRDLSFSNFSTLTKKIGFSVSRDNVTEIQDTSLRDPAIGSYNYNAPGADRYTINLILSQKELSETPIDFVELLRFEGGRITKKVERVTYGQIEEALARRTFDESGSYTVSPFDMVVKRGTPQGSTCELVLGTGKAYVVGREVENLYPLSVSFDSARKLQQESLSYPFTTGTVVSGVLSTSNTADLQQFTQNFHVLNGGSARAVFVGASGVVADGYIHGAVPNTEQGTIGRRYALYLYGLSGSVASGTTLNIYSQATNGLTLGVFSPSGAAFAIDFVGDSSLVFPVEPGYAVDSFTHFETRCIATTRNITPSTNQSTGTTVYTFTKADFADTISSSGSSDLFSIFSSDNIPSTTNSQDLAQISIVGNSSDSNRGGLVFTPSSGTLVINGNGNEARLTVVNAPEQLRTGGVRITAPLVYRPIRTSRAVNAGSDFRTKTSAPVTNQSMGAIKTDENGRKYYEFPMIDVYSVLGVTLSFGGIDTTATNEFELDSGQREGFYDNSRLYIKPQYQNEDRYSNTTSPADVRVSCLRFVHGGNLSGPFIGKHSYLNIPYSQIPLYTAPKTGKTVSLANCIDFRHSGATSDVRVLKPYGRSRFGSGYDTEVQYSHYLPRIDKVCVRANPDDGSPQFFFVEGTPELSPVAPPDPADALVLATLTIPAYTHNPSDVVITPVETKRFTMRDIGKMQKRMDEMEVFTKLSISESELESRSLRKADSDIEPLKTSIFSDEFYGHSIGDVTDRNYSCSVDYEHGELRPFFTTERLVPQAQPSLTTVRITEDGIAMLDFREDEHVSSLQYNRTIAANPSNSVNWLGFMKISPGVVSQYDTGFRPLVKTNSLMENDNWLSANPEDQRGFGTQWNDWESIWTGIEEVEHEQDDIQKRTIEVPRTSSNSAVPSHNSGNVRVGVSRKVETLSRRNSNYFRARNLKNRIKQRIGSRVVDRSVVPYIPTQAVTATVHGLKRNYSGLSVYFDGVEVASGISTDSSGSCNPSFVIPANTFTVGSKSVRISDSPITENATVAADAVFHCTGLIPQDEYGSVGVRPPHLRRQTPSSEYVATDPYNRDIDSVGSSLWSDPLSQTFFVDKKTNPDGVFVSKISLYFSKKDENLPVAVQLRPTVGGFPSPSVVYPFATAVVKAEDVLAGTVPEATEFVFSTPVYLPPGEHAICVLANSDDYELFAADSGISGIVNGEGVSGRPGNNQSVGTLFTAQGIGPAVENKTADLMFAVHRCEFQNSGNIQWTIDPRNAQVLKFYTPEIVPSSCTITRTLGSVEFLNNQTVYMKTPLSGGQLLTYQFRGGEYTTVSPVVDVGALYTAGVSIAENSEYITRVVELPQELNSNGIAVFLDAYCPPESSIDVYYRVALAGECEIFNKRWNLFGVDSDDVLVAPRPSTSEMDFRERAYRKVLPQNRFYNLYQIKVVMSRGGNSNGYPSAPSVRSVRAASFIR
jgi:hypothetical protein